MLQEDNIQQPISAPHPLGYPTPLPHRDSEPCVLKPEIRKYSPSFRVRRQLEAVRMSGASNVELFSSAIF